MHYIDHKYVRLVSSYLAGWKDAGNDVSRFRCPFCGDSKKNTAKKRGYLYPIEDTVAYKCHNCGASHGLSDFLQLISPELASAYKFEKFVEPKKRTKEQRAASVSEEEFQTDVKSRLKVTHKILGRCQKLLDLPEDHDARRYIDGRLIPVDAQKDLWYTDDVNIIYKSIPRYHDRQLRSKVEAVVIPFFDEDGVLTYLQCRALNSDLRYLTMEVEEGRKKIWGLHKIDWTKPVWVFEGPFDAMFLPNSIACAGVSSMLPESKYLEQRAQAGYVFVFDRDYESNYQVYFQFRRAVNDGLTVVLYDKQFQWNDANKAIEAGWSVAKLESYLKSRACNGLKAQLGLSTFKPPKKQ